MKVVLPWLGPMILLVMVFQITRMPGENWECGRLGMPAALLDEFGKVYQDGTPADAITLVIATSGYEQEIWLTAALLAIAASIWAMIAKTRREHHIRSDIMRREWRRLYGLPMDDLA